MHDRARRPPAPTQSPVPDHSMHTHRILTLETRGQPTRSVNTSTQRAASPCCSRRLLIAGRHGTAQHTAGVVHVLIEQSATTSTDCRTNSTIAVRATSTRYTRRARQSQHSSLAAHAITFRHTVRPATHTTALQTAARHASCRHAFVRQHRGRRQHSTSS